MLLNSSFENKIIPVQILIVNYGQWSATLNFIYSLKNQSIEIVVLDNFFSDNCRKKNKKIINIIKLLQVKIIEFNHNFGYLGAPIEYLKIKESKLFKWTIISNNDLILDYGSVIDTINNAIKRDSDIWSIAPSVKEESGKELNPYFQKPLTKYKKNAFKIYYINFLLAKFIQFLRKLFLPEKIENSKYEEYIFAQNGAIFILKNDLIKKITEEGLLSFLYGEEILISELIKRNSKKIFFTSSLRFTHKHSLSTGEGFSQFKFKWMKLAYKNSLKKGYKFYS